MASFDKGAGGGGGGKNLTALYQFQQSWPAAPTLCSLPPPPARWTKNLHIVACVLSPESLRKRPEEPVDETTVQRQVSLNEQCIALASRLTNGVRSSSCIVLKHHIYEPRNMSIKTGNEIKVDSYDWDPDQRGKRSFRGFPDHVQLSPASGVVNRSRS